MTPLVECLKVGHWFGKTLALDGVSFAIHRGEAIALVGPNGAGKSTLLRLLVGEDAPCEGSIRLFGEPMLDNPANLDRLGWVPDTRPGVLRIDTATYLDFFARSLSLTDSERLERLHEVADFWGLYDFLNKRLPDLSKGMAQRVSLARAMLSRPDILVADEPGDGLDPAAQEDLVKALGFLAARGVALLISSHRLEGLERWATRVIGINRGAIVFDGSAQQFFNADANANEAIPIRLRCLSPVATLKAALEIRPHWKLVRYLPDGAVADWFGGQQLLAREFSALAEIRELQLFEFARETSLTPGQAFSKILEN